MKTLYIFWVLLCLGTAAHAQADKLAAARSAYQGKQLEESRFALQQALNGLDLIIGKEVLQLLPTALGELKGAQEQVQIASGWAGVVVEREYQLDAKQADIQVVSNSPLMSAISATLTMPMLVGMSQNEQVVKVQGYKALLRSPQQAGEAWELHVPMGGSLLTLRAPAQDQNQLLQYAAQIPLSKVAALCQ